MKTIMVQGTAQIQLDADRHGAVLCRFSDGYVCELGEKSNRYAGGKAVLAEVVFPGRWTYEPRRRKYAGR